MLFKETIAVHGENYAKHVQNAELGLFMPVVNRVTTRLLWTFEIRYLLEWNTFVPDGMFFRHQMYWTHHHHHHLPCHLQGLSRTGPSICSLRMVIEQPPRNSITCEADTPTSGRRGVLEAWQQRVVTQRGRVTWGAKSRTSAACCSSGFDPRGYT